MCFHILLPCLPISISFSVPLYFPAVPTPYFLTPVSLHSANHSVSWCSLSVTFLTALHLYVFLPLSSPFSASFVPFSYTPSLLHSLPPHYRAPKVVTLPSCPPPSLLQSIIFLSSPNHHDALKAVVSPFILSRTLCEGPHHCCHPPTSRSRAPLPLLLSNSWRSGWHF